MSEQPRPATTGEGVQDIMRRLERIGEAMATNLKQSMERNARMKERLRKLHDHRGCPLDVRRALEDIMNDVEPVWHPD